MNKSNQILARLFADAVETISKCSEHAATLERIVEELISCFKKGGKVLVCGNGGSCADAAHFVAELTVRFEKVREPLPAICLGAAASELTALGNDYCFEETYRRLVMAHGRPGDCLVAISTSGNSANILAALEEAGKRGLKTIALLGKGGGEAAGLADVELIAPGGTTARVQEAHQVFVHGVCALIDDFYGE